MVIVSVIVPVYNVAQYLVRCVDSIISQTFSEIEILLVDDGSPDDSPQMCDEYANKYTNIKVIHKQNGGLSSARLAGYKEAQGQYVLFVDSDDYIEPTMVEEMVSAINKYHAEMTFCGYNTIHGSKSIPTLLPYNDSVIMGLERIRNDYVLPLFGPGGEGDINIPGFTCIRLYRKDLLKDEYFLSEREFFLEDHILNLLYADNLHTISIVNKPLYNYCVNYSSLSNCYRKNKWGMYANLLSWYKKYIEKRELHETETRLNYFTISALSATVDNAVNTGSLKEFLEELMPLYKDESFYHAMKDTKIGFNLHSHNITILLLKLRLLKLLYNIRRSRIIQSQNK